MDVIFTGEEISRFRKSLLNGINNWILDCIKEKTPADRENILHIWSMLEAYFVIVPMISDLTKETLDDRVYQLLKGFASYVAYQDDFLYNPNYLYERIEDFWLAIRSVNAHLDAICKHVLILQNKMGDRLKDYILEYNDFYVIRYYDDEWKFSVKYSNFKKFIGFTGQNVSVCVKQESKKEGTVIFNGHVSETEDRVTDIKKLMKLWR